MNVLLALVLSFCSVYSHGQVQYSTFSSPYASYSTEYALDGHYNHRPARAYGHYGHYHGDAYNSDYTHGYHGNHGYHGYNPHARYGHYNSYDHYPYRSSYYPVGNNYISRSYIKRGDQVSSPLTSSDGGRRYGGVVYRGSQVNYGSYTGSSKTGPYSFGYSSDSYDGRQSRQEVSNGNGEVSGAYSFDLPDGRQRVVEYTAGQQGFKANVKTNEPGTESQSPADVNLQSSALPAAQAAVLNDPHHT